MLLTRDLLLLVLALHGYCSCASVMDKEKPSVLGSEDLSAHSFQSWDDWLGKRNGLTWDSSDLAGEKFQQWQDWMYKRGLVGLNADLPFGSMDKSTFQGWSDWMSKRGLSSLNADQIFGNMDKSKFQGWSDWMSKRSMGTGSPLANPNDLQKWSDWDANGLIQAGHLGGDLSLGNKFQSWDDFTKRQNFPFPSTSLNFQTWQDWTKRMAPNWSRTFDKSNVSDKDHLMSWEDMLKNEKRPLSPFNLLKWRRYLKDGQQEWRSTLKGSKQSKGESSESGEQ